MSFVSQLSFLLFSLTVWLSELISWHILLFYFGEKHTYNKPSKVLVSSVIHYVQTYLWAWHAKIPFYRKKQYPPFLLPFRSLSSRISHDKSSSFLLFFKWSFTCQISIEKKRSHTSVWSTCSIANEDISLEKWIS